jgi:pyruvate dehydrogenase E1 component alpha subunit
MGIPAEQIPDGDPERIAAAARERVAALREGAGPFLLECLTYRWKEHVGPGEDWQLGYRSSSEAERWLREDPIPRLAGRLATELRARIEREVEAEIKDAFAFAESSPFPGPEELHRDVFRELP